jgi:hypothetical protein
MAREAQNLAFLRQLGHTRVCKTAGLHGGVLFTHIAPGVPLADVLAARPGQTGAFLDAVLLGLRELHGPAGARCLRDAAPIGERSINGVFRRKFNGPSTAAYLRALGQDSGLPKEERLEVIELVENAVSRLLPMTRAISPRRDTVTFGDLKPEHVFLDVPPSPLSTRPCSGRPVLNPTSPSSPAGRSSWPSAIPRRRPGNRSRTGWPPHWPPAHWASRCPLTS